MSSSIRSSSEAAPSPCMRQALAAISWPRHPETPVTASFGVADNPGEGNLSDPSGWIDAADKALYIAKEKGRNQVRFVRIK